MEGLIVYKNSDGSSIRCQFCRQCVRRDFTQACFIFDKNLQDVIENCTRSERKQHIETFLRMVNALLNEGGGVIYIHSQPHLLGFWDEQIDNDLMELVADDTLFTENFERQVISAENHVIFRVKARPGNQRRLSTRQFNSKVPLNKGLADPTHAQMRRLVTVDREPADITHPPQRVLQSPSPLRQGEVVEFHENVNTQAKVVQEKKLQRTRGDTRVLKLMNYWWADLKLPSYIAAFTKQGSGGSFFLGLREEKIETQTRWKAVPHTEGLAPLLGGSGERRFWRDDKNDELVHIASEEHVPKWEHKTGRFICEGVVLPEREHAEFRRELKRRVRDDLRAQSIRIVNPNLEDLVHIFFHPVEGGSTLPNGFAQGAQGAEGGVPDLGGKKIASDLYVVEARVMYFHGVCFQNREGPEAYCFDVSNQPSRAVRVSMENWVRGQQCVAAQA